MKKIKYQNLPISIQITGIAFVVILGLAMFVILFSANQIVDSKNSVAKSICKNKSFGVTERIDRIFWERYMDNQTFAQNKSNELILKNQKTTIDDQDFINKIIRLHQLYDHVYIINSNGKILANDSNNRTSKTPHIKQQWQHDYFVKNISTPSFSYYFQTDNNATIANLTFVAPIQNRYGKNIGLWCSTSNMKHITKNIIKKNEENLHMSSKEAFILIVDSEGKIIDASDSTLITKNTITANDFLKGKTFNFKEKLISTDKYIIGQTTSSGIANTNYKGNGWTVLVFYPQYKLSLSILYTELKWFTLAILCFFVVGIQIFHYLSHKISNKIVQLQNYVQALSEGKIIEIPTSQNKDEVGQMANAIATLMNRMQKKASFAAEIGKGNFEAIYEPLSNDDILGNSLLTMRNNLKKLHELLNERTRELQLPYEEITTQNEEIKAQSENIYKLNEELENIVIQRTLDLENTLLSLKIRNDDLEKFSYIVAHNLKGPVSSLKGLFPLFDFENLANTNNKDVMNYTKRTIMALDEVIKDLNYVFELKNNANQNLETVSFEEELNKISILLDKEISQSKAQIIYNFTQAPTYFSYTSYFQNIFYNIISNALKYAKENEAPIIDIRSHITNNKVIMKISDNGIGINLKQIKSQNLFDMYQRYNFEKEGKGLGLFLVKSQIDSLNGNIWVDSEPNIGTTITIELPIIIH